MLFYDLAQNNIEIYALHPSIKHLSPKVKSLQLNKLTFFFNIPLTLYVIAFILNITVQKTNEALMLMLKRY